MQIDAETLRDWLDTHRHVTVLDIRTDDDRAQWAIPGSIHLNAYAELRSGKAGPLADVALPTDRPVVTVCNAGRVSEAAADVLARRGLDARSLAGGMKGWSLAWNIADVPVPDTSVSVIQIRRTGKGCLSYVIGSRGEAAVVDPSLSPDLYIETAARRGWRIRYVLETHIHADHLSRGRQLAERAGATLVLPQHLHANAEGVRRRARTLFQSLRHLSTLRPTTLVLPGHTSEPIPFDRRAVCSEKWSATPRTQRKRMIIFLRRVLNDLEKQSEREGVAIAARELPASRTHRKARMARASMPPATRRQRRASRVSAQPHARRSTRARRQA